MSRWLILLLFLAATSCVIPDEPRRAPTGDFQPLEPGLEWTYEENGVIQTRKVVGVEPVGRFECHVVEARTGSAVVRSWMRWDKDGLKVYRISDGERTVEFDDPLLLVHRLSAPGATWSFEERHGPVTLMVDARHEADEDVAAADGVFKCARIRLIKRVSGRVVVDQTSWYARDFGLIKMTSVVVGPEKEIKTTLLLKWCNLLPD